MQRLSISRWRWLLLGLGVLVFLAGWSLALVRGPRPPAPRRALPGRAALVQEKAGSAIRAGATVLYRKVFFPSGRTEESEEPAPAALVGMRQQDLALYYPQWQVESFSPDRVVLRQNLPEPWRHVRLEGGEVVVYYGRTGHLGPMLARTGIAADRLPPVDRHRLERGIDLEGDEAVRAFLESDAS